MNFLQNYPFILLVNCASYNFVSVVIYCSNLENIDKVVKFDHVLFLVKVSDKIPRSSIIFVLFVIVNSSGLFIIIQSSICYKVVASCADKNSTKTNGRGTRSA